MANSNNNDEAERQAKIVQDYINEGDIDAEERTELVNMLDHLLEDERTFQTTANGDSLKRFIVELNHAADQLKDESIRPNLALTEKANFWKLKKEEAYAILKDLQERQSLNPNASIFSKRSLSTINLFPLSFIQKNKQKEAEFAFIRDLARQREKLPGTILDRVELSTLRAINKTPTKNSQNGPLTPLKELFNEKGPASILTNGTNTPGGFQTPTKNAPSSTSKLVPATTYSCRHKSTSKYTKRASRLRFASASPLIKKKVKRKIFADRNKVKDLGDDEIIDLVQNSLVGETMAENDAQEEIKDKSGVNAIMSKLDSIQEQLVGNKVDQTKIANEVEENKKVTRKIKDVTIPDLSERVSKLEVAQPDRELNDYELEIEKIKNDRQRNLYLKFIDTVLELGLLKLYICSDRLTITRNNVHMVDEYEVSKLLGHEIRQVEIWLNHNNKFEAVVVAVAESGYERKRAVRKILEARKEDGGKKLAGKLGVSIKYPEDSSYDVSKILKIWVRMGLIKDHGISFKGEVFFKISNPKNSSDKQKDKENDLTIYPACPRLLVSLNFEEINAQNLAKLKYRKKYIIGRNRILELNEQTIHRTQPEHRNYGQNLTVDPEMDTRGNLSIECMEVEDADQGDKNDNKPKWGQKYDYKNGRWVDNKSVWQRNKVGSSSGISSASRTNTNTTANTNARNSDRYFNRPWHPVEKTYNFPSSDIRERDPNSNVTTKYFGHRYRHSRSLGKRIQPYSNGLSRYGEEKRYENEVSKSNDRKRDRKGNLINNKNSRQKDDEDRYQRARERGRNATSGSSSGYYGGGERYERERRENRLRRPIFYGEAGKRCHSERENNGYKKFEDKSQRRRK